jgi:cell division protein FtsN
MKQQRGGTILGFILGLVVGLGVALAVAVYVTKVPIPFLSKASSRSADQDATEIQKNKDWDPNAPLYGKNSAKPAQPGASVAPAPVAASSGDPQAGAVRATPAMLASASAPVKPEPKPAVTADPLGDLAKQRATPAMAGVAAPPASTAAEPFTYFVQVGAFRTLQDAETQRAKLTLAGVETKVSEREQSGRTVYRVRVGPFERREEADKSKLKLEALGIETALVRVQR